jgi:hypothetical protein
MPIFGNMKKLLILALAIVAGVVIWNKVAHRDGDDALTELQHRLEMAEQTFQQAGRAAGATGMDTSADASAAVEEVARVERELRDLDRAAPSADERRRIQDLLARAADLRRRMG